ncbi:hypothetical protein D3C75_771930 [compost metagenome]
MKLHGGSRQVPVLGRCERLAQLSQCELHRFFRCDTSGHIILSFFEVVKYFLCAVATDHRCHADADCKADQPVWRPSLGRMPSTTAIHVLVWERHNENYKGSADHDTIFRAAGGRWCQPGGRLVRVWQTGEIRRIELGKRDAAHGRDAVRAEKWLWL